MKLETGSRVFDRGRMIEGQCFYSFTDDEGILYWVLFTRYGQLVQRHDLLEKLNKVCYHERGGERHEITCW